MAGVPSAEGLSRSRDSNVGRFLKERSEDGKESRDTEGLETVFQRGGGSGDTAEEAPGEAERNDDEMQSERGQERQLGTVPEESLLLTFALQRAKVRELSSAVVLRAKGRGSPA